MSRDTEKVFRELHAFLEGKEFANEEDTNKAIQEFMDRYNNEQRPVDDFGEDAWGYLDRAYEAETLEETLKYAKRALKLDKDLVDAELVIAEITAKGFHDLLKKYEQMIKKTEKRLKEEGHFEEDCVGHFWGILETRPYMRLRYHHMEGLISMGRYHQAIKNCEELLELCPGDNMGVRYRLISLYAFLEDEMNLDITGFDWESRRDNSLEFFTTNNEYLARGFLVNNQIDYIYLVGDQKINLNESQLQINQIFDNGQVKIYQVQR